jgi:hypothetical protein
MKKIIILVLLAAITKVTTAAETVIINNSKFTKYSDAEIGDYIAKMNSVRPDMTVDQVTALLGKPVREEVVSASPPQRIIIFRLAVIVSFRFDRASRTWRVTAPPLYGSPLCQREDGRPMKNSLGIEIIDYPSITCIPQRFVANSGSKSKAAPLTSQFSNAEWKLIHKGAGGRENSNEMYIDSSSMKTIPSGNVEVTLLRSFDTPRRDEGPTFQSEISRLVISCNERMWGSTTMQRFAYEMGRGKITNDWKSAGELQKIAFEGSWPDIVANVVCKNL